MTEKPRTEESLVIREMTERDMDHVFNIEAGIFPDPFDARRLDIMRRWFPSACLVAEKNGKIVGYILATLRSPTLGHILSVAVIEEERGKGIGSALIRKSMEIMKSRGASAVRLEVRTDNMKAIKLYKKMGYKIDQLIPDYYSDGSDAYVMFIVDVEEGERRALDDLF